MACGCVLPSESKVRLSSFLSFSLNACPSALQIDVHDHCMLRYILAQFESKRVRGSGDIAGA